MISKLRTMRRHEEQVMGTVVTFDLFDERGFDDEAVAQVFVEAVGLLHRVDKTFSTWKHESPLSMLRRGEIGLGSLSDEVVEVLEECKSARDLTGGWFDPWSMPGGVDPTGYVKGWAAQSALDVLARLGAEGAIVNAAGDIAVSGRPSREASFRVGIVNPFVPRSLACVAEVSESIATSGEYERGEHLVNPFAPKEPARLASATVCGPDLGLADAFATALVVGGKEALEFVAAVDGYEAMTIGHDASWMTTSGFPLASAVTL